MRVNLVLRLESQVFICIVFGWVFAANSTPAQTFQLQNNEHLDVISFFTQGTLFDSSSVNVTTGGEVERLFTYNDSSATIANGGIVGEMFMGGNSSLVLNVGGTISEAVYTWNTSNVSILGGTVAFFVSEDLSNLGMTGGTIERMWAEELRLGGANRIHATGGNIQELNANIRLQNSELLNYSDELTLNQWKDYGVHLDPGVASTINTSVTTFGQSHLSITGGNLNRVNSYESSSVQMSAGTLENIASWDPGTSFSVSGGILTTIFSFGTLEISGGSVENLSTLGQSAFQISGGDITFAYFESHSQGSITGGNFNRLWAFDSSSVAISEGNITNLFVYDLRPGGINRLEISGGNIENLKPHINLLGSEHLSYSSSYSLSDLSAFGVLVTGGAIENLLRPTFSIGDNSLMNVSGGEIDEIYLFESSTAVITGGHLGGVSNYGNGSSVYIEDGSVGQLNARINSYSALLGGELNRFFASEFSEVFLAGGSLTYFEARDFSTITIKGYDFQLGTGLSWDTDGITILGTGLLNGKWLGQSDIWTIEIGRNDLGATIRAIPEPSSWLLSLAIASPMLLLRRRRPRTRVCL